MKMLQPLVLLVPGKKGIRRFELTVPSLFLSGMTALVLAACILCGNYCFAQAAYWTARGWYAGRENRVASRYLSYLDREVRRIDGLLQRVFQSNDIVRSLYDLEPISPEARRVGIGGANLSNAANSDLLRIERQIAFEQWNLKRTRTGIFEKMNAFGRLPLITPTAGRITSRFGVRVHPVLESTDFHQGLDIANRGGTQVLAPAKGRIADIGYDPVSGRYIRINHGNGFETWYAHLQKVLVVGGQAVSRHQAIGTIGRTGRATGDHLHYEIHYGGQAKDPETYILPEKYVVD